MVDDVCVVIILSKLGIDRIWLRVVIMASCTGKYNFDHLRSGLRV